MPRRRSDPLTRDRILDAGLALADAVGVEGLSMRKLADTLGTGAMSLYNHVANKDDLIDGMLDRLASDWVVARPADDWKGTLRASLISSHASLVAHPWACVLMASRPNVGMARMAYFDGILQTLLAAGFSPRQARHGFLALDTQVLGFAQSEANIPTGSEGTHAAAQAFLDAVPQAQFPGMTAMMQDLLKAQDYTYPFVATVDLILDGLERELTRGGAQA